MGDVTLTLTPKEMFLLGLAVGQAVQSGPEAYAPLMDGLHDKLMSAMGAPADGASAWFVRSNVAPADRHIIQAIKTVRFISRMGLKESKDLLDTASGPRWVRLPVPDDVEITPSTVDEMLGYGFDLCHMPIKDAERPR